MVDFDMWIVFIVLVSTKKKYDDEKWNDCRPYTMNTDAYVCLFVFVRVCVCVDCVRVHLYVFFHLVHKCLRVVRRAVVSADGF